MARFTPFVLALLIAISLGACSSSSSKTSADAAGDISPGDTNGADLGGTDASGLDVEPGDAPGGDLARPDTAIEPDVIPTAGTLYFVRPDGGDRQQCTGTANAPYPGSGTGQACAFNHLFQLLPPESGTPLLKGGDTVFVASGEYRMGLGAPGATGCDSGGPWTCHMPPIPSGPSADKPTRILGEGYQVGCPSPPRLFGSDRVERILNLDGSSNVELGCLEVTDKSQCVEFHSGSLECQRDAPPYGEWASIGLYAADSKNVTLRHVDIHGLAHTGILAGRLENWLLEDVKIEGNGWVGWDGDLADPTNGSSNSGSLTFRRVSISWNGCGETWPGRAPIGCWAQTAGGYGDGLGTANTGGDWLFEDSRVMHNTSDGIDLLYHVDGGTVTVTRTRAEGNAGNQLKTAGNARITNSILVGNCAFFDGKSFTYNVDNCRALGNTVQLALLAGTTVELVNNTIAGHGDVLIGAAPRDGFQCNGSEKLTLLNNILRGDDEFLSPGDTTALFYQEGCNGLALTADYNQIFKVKTSLYVGGTNDKEGDPLLPSIGGDESDVLPPLQSPAVDSGQPVGGLIPSIDFYGKPRPSGKGVDRGAIERPQ